MSKDGKKIAKEAKKFQREYAKVMGVIFAMKWRYRFLLAMRLIFMGRKLDGQVEG